MQRVGSLGKVVSPLFLTKFIGVGNRDNRQLGDTGLICIDDIFVTNRIP